MVIHKEFQIEEHAAMLQNKAILHNNILQKRKEQLKNWENSELNKICPKKKSSHLSKVKFQNDDIFLSACQSADEDEVEELLNKGSDINCANIDGVTALHQAVIDGNMDFVRFLVQHNADINAQDNEGWTPLHAAVCCGNLNITKYLYEHNADLACVNIDKELPIDLAESDEMRNYLGELMRSKNIDEKTARESEYTKMLEDCRSLIQSGSSLDIPHPKTGATLLHMAASRGYVKIIEMLLAAGADVNAVDFEGWTPLQAAEHWGEKEAVRILSQQIPPTQSTSQEEAESVRKSKSKLKRSTRRSTQGVTLEQLEEAAGCHNGSHNNNNTNGNCHNHQVANQDPNDDLPPPIQYTRVGSENGINIKTKCDSLLHSYVTEKALPGTSAVDQKIQRIVDSNKKLRQQLEEAEKNLYNRRQRPREEYNSIGSNSSSDDSLHRDALKQVAEMKLKLQEMEREKTALEGAFGRSETQLKRFKTIAEQAEKESEELQKQNRQLKKELRNKGHELEDCKETINHLQSRLEKMRNIRRPI